MRPKSVSRQVGEAVSELLGHAPVKYLPNYERGSAIFWELRKTAADQHEQIKKQVEERLQLFERKIEVKLSMERGTTRVFVFIHNTPKNVHHTRPRERYGRTFGRKGY